MHITAILTTQTVAHLLAVSLGPNILHAPCKLHHNFAMFFRRPSFSEIYGRLRQWEGMSVGYQSTHSNSQSMCGQSVHSGSQHSSTGPSNNTGMCISSLPTICCILTDQIGGYENFINKNTHSTHYFYITVLQNGGHDCKNLVRCVSLCVCLSH